MRRPELSKEEMRELISIEQDRHNDYLEEIIHLENKLNPYGYSYSYTEYLETFAPNKPVTGYRCKVCGETNCSDMTCANGCGFGDTMEAKDNEGE